MSREEITMRRIASDWHGGQGSPLYAFSSSGYVADNALDEVHQCQQLVRDQHFDAAADELEQLEKFLSFHHGFAR